MLQSYKDNGFPEVFKAMLEVKTNISKLTGNSTGLPLIAGKRAFIDMIIIDYQYRALLIRALIEE